MSQYDANAVRTRYGRLPKSDAEVLAYAKAVKIIIGADGEIAPEEKKAFDKGLARLGASRSVIDELKSFDHAKAKLDDVVGGLRKGGVRARALLRDAIEIASADGVYAKEEREMAHRAATLLGVDHPTLHAIEALVAVERAAAQLRNAVLPKKKGA